MSIELVGIAVIGALALTFGYSIVEPMARASHEKPSVSTFYLIDFFSLSFLLAVPLCFLANVWKWNYYRVEELPFLQPVGVILLLVFAYAWWRGMTALSSADVSHSGKRFLYLAVLTPIAIIGSAVVVPFLSITALNIPNFSRSTFAGWCAGVITTVAIAFGGRKASQWIVTNDVSQTNRLTTKN
jgi:general stress protein CsbA